MPLSIPTLNLFLAFFDHADEVTNWYRKYLAIASGYLELIKNVQAYIAIAPTAEQDLTGLSPQFPQIMIALHSEVIGFSG